MAIKPTPGHVLVLPKAPADRTDSGILLPDSAQKKSQRGVVVAVGSPKEEHRGYDLVEGGIALFSKYGGTEIEEEGQTYVLLRYEDVLGTVG